MTAHVQFQICDLGFQISMDYHNTWRIDGSSSIEGYLVPFFAMQDMQLKMSTNEQRKSAATDAGLPRARGQYRRQLTIRDDRPWDEEFGLGQIDEPEPL